MMVAQTPRAIPTQRGMVLVTALLLLVVVTLLAVGMFRSFGLDEKIAGNVREKQRALSAAETAEQYAEWWLSNGNSTTGITCAAGLVSSNVGQVCSNALINPTTLPWTLGVNYVYSPNTATTMSASTSGGAGTYYYTPNFYVQYLNTVTSGGNTQMFYQIDSVGYGGSPDTAAVVEAIYSISNSVKCDSCGQ
jgi:type IV pilus assembly protein PilX